MVAKKSIYVVLSKTHTGIGRLIRAFSRYPYSHVSIATTFPIDEMYSFARYHSVAPLMGGFVVEHPHRFLFPDTDVKIFRLELEEEAYNQAMARLDAFLTHADEYLFNTISIITLLFKRHFYVPKAYVCLEFVMEVLGLSGLTSLKQLEEALAPYEYFTGSFRACVDPAALSNMDSYFDPLGIGTIVKGSLRHMKTLFSRRRILK
ncbi:hypothetical protein LJC20_05650 [Eubacteriales bacterium OttesenSCG-928-M02]|nr:hypothetical protein [Eubacteriales bacterium OttesenSCG-928-M02]